jgi:hypothetical protein
VDNYVFLKVNAPSEIPLPSSISFQLARQDWAISQRLDAKRIALPKKLYRNNQYFHLPIKNNSPCKQEELQKNLLNITRASQ